MQRCIDTGASSDPRECQVVRRQQQKNDGGQSYTVRSLCLRPWRCLSHQIQPSVVALVRSTAQRVVEAVNPGQLMTGTCGRTVSSGTHIGAVVYSTALCNCQCSCDTRSGQNNSQLQLLLGVQEVSHRYLVALVQSVYRNLRRHLCTPSALLHPPMAVSCKYQHPTGLSLPT